MPKGMNMASVKENNRRNILRALKNRGHLSRKDIAEAIGLTAAAVTILVNDMIEEGLLREAGHLEEYDRRVGRKKILVDIAYKHRKVIGMMVGPEITGIGVADLQGRIIAEQEYKVKKALRPEDFLREIAGECMKLLWNSNIRKEEVLGVGVAIVGPVVPEDGVSQQVYGLWNKPIPVKDILEKQLQLPVILDNNVRCLARAEFDFSEGITEDNILFIKDGPGIGASVMFNKGVYYGSHNMAAEIGHIIVKKGGNLCRCGQRGCLEAEASTEVVLKKIGCIFSRSNTPHLYRRCDGDRGKIDLAGVFAVLEKEPVLKEILDKTASFLAVGIFNAVQMYDPGVVILYGPIFLYPVFRDMLAAHLEELNPGKGIKNLLQYSKLDSCREYLGGISLAINNFFYNA